MTGGRAQPDHLVVGRITKAHGTKGEVFVWLMTDHAETVFEPGRSLRLGDEEGRIAEDLPALVVERVRPFKQGLLVLFEGVADRSAAETWPNRLLLAPRATLTGPEEGEAYYHDLVGLAVETVSGGQVGRVVTVYEASPADLLEVETERGKRILVPLSRQVVREIEVTRGRLVIEPPPGLLDL